MTVTEAADAILWGLLKQEEDGKDGIGYITGAAETHGISDDRLIERAAKLLDEQGLLEHFNGFARDGRVHYIGSLNGRAVTVMEQLPRGASVMQAVRRPPVAQPSNHYHGPVIQGVQGSNVAIASPNAKQAISNGAEVGTVVQALIAAIKADQSLPVGVREEAVEHAETLKDELEKTKPNSKVVMTILGWLSVSSLAGEYIQKIKEALGY